MSSNTVVLAFTAAILVTPLGALSVVSKTMDPTGKERITSPDLACFFLNVQVVCAILSKFFLQETLTFFVSIQLPQRVLAFNR
jgi:hypothetical protein